MLSPRMLECSNSDQTDVREARSRSHFMLLTSIFFQSAPPPRPIPFYPTLSSHSPANLVLLLVSLPPAARLRRGNPLSLNKDSPQALIRSGARPVCVIVCVVCVRVIACAYDTYSGSERDLSGNLLCENVRNRQRQTVRDCLHTLLRCKNL